MNKLDTDFYAEATSRNIGLLQEHEQEILRKSTVAIVGMGAAGGHHLLTLARLGVGNFIIADPDEFDIVNLHRQAGAFCDTMGRNKAEVMAETVKRINPQANVRVYPVAVDSNNIDEFLQGADLVVDGIEFFEIDARRMVFDKAREKGLYAITAGPVGYGSSVQIFAPDGMSFDRYFGIKPGMTRAERLACFGVGLLPKIPKGRHMNASKVDFERQKGPALISAIMICSGIMVTEALRVLLKREGIRAIPHSYYFDPYGKSYTHGFARFGKNRLRDRLMRWMAFRIYPSLQRLHEAELNRTRAASSALPGLIPDSP